MKSPILTWLLLRKTVQYLFLAGFIVLAVGIRLQAWPSLLSRLPFQLDPLTSLLNSLAARHLADGFLLSAGLILLTVIFGRAWCGWICPLGTILDSFPLQPKRSRNLTAPPEGWRKVKYALLLLLVAGAVLANLTLLPFDPLTLLFRTLTVAILPALDSAISAVEIALYPIPFLQASLAWIDSALRPVVIPLAPAFYRDAVLFGLGFLAVVLLNQLAPRFWCRYICPLGGMLGLISKGAIFQRRVNDNCKNCQLCSRECPMGTVQPKLGFASDPAECTLCLDCLVDCPKEAVTIRPVLPKPSWNRYDPSRREAFALVGAAVAGVALAGSTHAPNGVLPFLIQPPGSRENDLLSKCVRCGECLRACPTSGLQPSLTEAGIEGFWSPVLVPRIGYCDYACNACGEVCPVEAIPRLTLEEKRQVPVGKAYINQNRCLAWSDHTPCIVCEEMCPLPDKAIKLQVAEVVSSLGDRVELQLPYVVRERCIGCGICEYKCPVATEAAIRVYSLGAQL